MLEEARNALPECHFVESDIRHYKPAQPLSLIYANASLQWIPDHYTLLPHLVSLLRLNGVLAIQMPDNWLEPTHVKCAIVVIFSSRWIAVTTSSVRSRVLPPAP